MQVRLEFAPLGRHRNRQTAQILKARLASRYSSTNPEFPSASSRLLRIEGNPFKVSGALKADAAREAENREEAEMTGLIVKGAKALFLRGSDPGPEAAVAVVNRYNVVNARSLADKLVALNLKRVARPIPLSRESLAWAYVFVNHTESDSRRLEPGPFDDELADIVAAIEREERGLAGTIPVVAQP